MISIKNQRGITLIGLIITIIVLLILASITVYVGTESIDYSRMVKFESYMQTIQKKVDLLAGNGEYETLGETIENLSLEQQIMLENAINMEGMSIGTRRLPSEYQEVEYLESSGSQYIDTKRVPNMNDIIEQKFQTLNTTGSKTISWYGSMPSSTSTTPRLSLGVYSSGFFAGVNQTFNLGSLDDKVHTLKLQAIENTRLIYIFDDIEKDITASNLHNPAVNLTSYLFARHGTNGVQAFDGNGTRIYYHKEYLANNTLVLDLVPCYRKSDEKPGLFDLVSETFFVNQGTGEFTIGPLVFMQNVTTQITISSNIPLAYQEIEYLESSGTQYIDTNRVPNMNDIIEQKFQTLNTSTSSNVKSWYGSIPSLSKIIPRFSMGIYSSGFFAGVNQTVNIGPLNNKVHTVKWQAIEDDKFIYIFDDVEHEIDNLEQFTVNTQLTSYLFARHGNDGVQTYDGNGTRIYYHREYLADNTLVLNLVPCYRKSDEKPGLIDLVSGNFFTNQGTGEFEMGEPVTNTITYNTNSENHIRYFDSTAIARDLDIENIDDEIVVNFETREVISLNGVEYDGQMYYAQYRLPGGQKLKQNTTEISRQISWEDFTITPNINGLNATFTITGIEQTNGTLSYSIDNQTTWKVITNYTVANQPVTTENLTKSGTYWFKWTDNTNKNNIFILDSVQIKLANAPKLKGSLELVLVRDTYNYSDLNTNSDWAYATANDVEYVWIPRFAYIDANKDGIVEDIQFLKGTSDLTTSDGYITTVEEWILPDVFVDKTGVWVRTDSYFSNDIIEIIETGTILQ